MAPGLSFLLSRGIGDNRLREEEPEKYDLDIMSFVLSTALQVCIGPSITN